MKKNEERYDNEGMTDMEKIVHFIWEDGRYNKTVGGDDFEAYWKRKGKFITNKINEIDESTPKTREEMVAEINYNNMCARATLFPGLGIDDIPVLTVEDVFGKQDEKSK
jgi:hypothetical protein